MNYLGGGIAATICASLAGSVLGLAYMLSGGYGTLLVYEPLYELGSAVPGQEFEVAFKVRNRADEAVRLIGCTETCGPAGCATIADLPQTVPAHSEIALSVSFKAGIIGQRVKRVRIFTDCPKKPEVELAIRANVQLNN